MAWNSLSSDSERRDSIALPHSAWHCSSSGLPRLRESAILYRMRQHQFLDVIDRDEAERRFRAALDLRPLGAESVPLAAALGRVLAEDAVAPLDVPGFDRSNVDGFAVRAEDTFGAADEQPRR